MDVNQTYWTQFISFRAALKRVGGCLKMTYDNIQNRFFVERKGYCKIGYTEQDLEKVAFYFQNTNIIKIIFAWIKFRFMRRAYE